MAKKKNKTKDKSKSKGKEKLTEKNKGRKKNNAKKKKESKNEHATTGEHYCEYVCTDGDWYLIGANIDSPPEYCPHYSENETDGGVHEGYVVRIDPYKYDEADPELRQDPDFDPGVAPSFFYCKYNYDRKHKCFILAQANCPRGHYAPRFISLTHLKEHGFVSFPIPIPVDNEKRDL